MYQTESDRYDLVIVTDAHGPGDYRGHEQVRNDAIGQMADRTATFNGLIIQE
jgi:hypothetical protein